MFNATSQQSSKNKSVSNNKQDGSQKRSRVSSNFNSTANKRAVKNANLVDLLMDENKPKKYPKLTSISENKEFYLQVDPRNKHKTLLELADLTMKYGTNKYKQYAFQAAVASKNKAASELINQPAHRYYPDQPGTLDLTGIAAINRPAAVDNHRELVRNYQKEDQVLREDRVQLIIRLEQTMSPDLWEQVIGSFPDYMINPNLLAITERVDQVFNLAHFEGRKEDFHQQVESAMAQFYDGEIAYNNYTKNSGTFDLPYHKRLFIQLMAFRKQAGEPAYTDEAQAIRFIKSCGSIRYLKEEVERLKINAYQYGQMPQDTLDQIEAARAFNKMPLSLQAAYDHLATIKESNVLYKDDLKAILQSSTMSSYPISGTQRGNVKEDSSDEQSCIECAFHPGAKDHTTLTCRLLPAAVLALKAQQAANKNNKSSSSASTSNEPKSKKKGDKPKEKKKFTQKATVVIEDEDEDSDYSADKVLQYIKGVQRSHVEYNPVVHSEVGSNPFLTLWDTACSKTVSEFLWIPPVKHRNGKTYSIMGPRKSSRTSYVIDTSNGPKRIKDAIKVEVKGFGECLCNNNRNGTNMISQTYVEKYYKVDVIRVKNQTMSYHVHMPNYDVMIPFDIQPSGVFIGDLSVLADKEWQPLPEPYSDAITIHDQESLNDSGDPRFQCKKLNMAVDDIDPMDYKGTQPEYYASLIKSKSSGIEVSNKVSHTIPIQTKRELTFAQEVVLPNIGYPAARAFETMVNKGMIINVPVAANALRRAEDELGKPLVIIKAKTNAQHKKSNLVKYFRALDGKKERLIMMDLMFIDELVFFLAVSYPGLFSVLTYIGYGVGCREAESILPHMLYAFSTVKAMQKTIKFVTGDGEGGFGKLKSEIQAAGGLFIPVNKNEHLPHLDINVKKLKMMTRASIIGCGYHPPRKLRVGAALTAVHLMNYLSTTGNPESASPMMFELGVPLDFKDHANIRTLQMVEVKVEDPKKSNTMAPRTVTGIASHPCASQGWWIYNLLTRKLIRSQSFVVVRQIPEIFRALSEIRVMELERMKDRPQDTVVVAVQAKQFNWRDHNFQIQKDTFGEISAAVAIHKELRGFIEKKQVWHPVKKEDIPKEYVKSIQSLKTLFNLKPKEEEIITLKARIVANNTGNRSEFDHYKDIQAPTVETVSIFLNLIDIAMRKLAIVTIDFPQAFLNAEQDRPQYAKITKELAKFVCVFWPEYKKFLNSDGIIYVQLDKALYGQIQAPRRFNDKLHKWLTGLGYARNPVDPGVYTKKVPNSTSTDNVDSESPKITLNTHVDDLFSGVPTHYVATYIKEMKDTFGNDITIHTNLGYDCQPESFKEVEYLGMIISCDYSKPAGLVNGKKYFNKALAPFQDIIGDTVKKVPSKANFLDCDSKSTLLTAEPKARFESLIYKIRYAAVIFAPDLAYHSAQFIRWINKGLTEDMKEKAIHFAKYVKGRANTPLQIGPGADGKVHLALFVDANFDIESYSCCCITSGLGIFDMKSLRQKEHQLASAHTELIAASTGIARVMHIQHLMESTGWSKASYSPYDLYEDNMAVIHLIKNGRANNSKSKHLHIRHFWMKQYYDNGEFQIIHCPTEEMVADMGTKPKVGEAFLYNRDRMLGSEYVYVGK